MISVREQVTRNPRHVVERDVIVVAEFNARGKFFLTVRHRVPQHLQRGQFDAVFARIGGHARDVALQRVEVDHQCRRGDGGDRIAHARGGGELTEDETRRLAAGDAIQRPQTVPIGERRYIGGLAYAVIEASPDELVIVLGPTPILPKHVPQCIEQGAPEACDLSREAFERQGAAMAALLRGVVARHANARYLDLSPWFCDATHCPAMRDGLALYWDASHVSSTAATRFAPEILAENTNSLFLRARATPPAPRAG